jgi:universal stress protein E
MDDPEICHVVILSAIGDEQRAGHLVDSPKGYGSLRWRHLLPRWAGRRNQHHGISVMKVLIAVDDSPESRHAVDIAYRFFGADADYGVLSVGERAPIYIGGYGAGAMPTAADLHDQIDAAHDVAVAAVTKASEHLPSGIETDVAEGRPGFVICTFAAEHRSDVIVIGSHERGWWDRLFDPSVSRHLIEHAPCPVLVVR